MIKKLKRQIFWTIFVILMITTAVILISKSISDYHADIREEYTIMLKLGKGDEPEKRQAEDGPKEAAQGNPETREPEPMGTFGEYYIVKEDAAGELLCEERDENNTYTEEEILSMAGIALTGEESKGMINNLRYSIRKKNEGRQITFMESRAKQQLQGSILHFLLYYVLASILFVGTASFLSRKIVKPVGESFDRQKQFISDASHELKTPITVINANIELLRGDVGENKWMDFIQAEGERMNSLLTNLLTLTRVNRDADGRKMAGEFAEFNLSSTLLSAALPFESLAYEHGIQYSVEIEENVRYMGNQEEIRQLAVILLDNAMKYTEKGGNVVISMNKVKNRKHKTVLEVKNTGREIEPQEQEKIFDRFYRLDKSRNRATGSFGLGLAIAKSIVQKHHGEIAAGSKGGWNTFTVKL